MQSTIHNEQNGLNYTLCGEYYLPNLFPPQTEEKEIGIWGMRHLKYKTAQKSALHKPADNR